MMKIRSLLLPTCMLPFIFSLTTRQFFSRHHFPHRNPLRLTKTHLLTLLQRINLFNKLNLLHKSLTDHHCNRQQKSQRQHRNQRHQNVLDKTIVRNALRVKKNQNYNHQQQKLHYGTYHIATGYVKNILQSAIPLFCLFQLKKDRSFTDLTEYPLLLQLRKLLLYPSTNTLLVNISHRPATLTRHN